MLRSLERPFHVHKEGRFYLYLQLREAAIHRMLVSANHICFEIANHATTENFAPRKYRSRSVFPNRTRVNDTQPGFTEILASFIISSIKP